MVFQVGKTKAQAALSLIGYEDELRPAMEYVFGSTFVCDTLEDAKKVCINKINTVISLYSGHPWDQKKVA